MMPDELPSHYLYENKPKDELVRLLYQRDGEINGWRQLWLDACGRIKELEGGHGRSDQAIG